MLDKIWRFIKQLIQRLFGTNPKIKLTPPQPAPTLTDAEYEAKLMELLEGVNGGWGRGDVAGFLIAKQIKNGELAAWLRRFGTRLLEGAQGSTASADAVVSLQELARRLELLGRVAGGELGEVAGNVGREILVEFPVVSVGGDEDVDRAAEEWYNRGKEQCALGNFEGAIASYDKALAIKPDYHEVWNNRGLVVRNLGNFEDALASYDKALEIKPDYDDAWYNRGLALDDLRRFQEAIESYDKALEIKPDDQESLRDRGVVLFNLGKLEDAIASYEKALAIKPDDDKSWYNRGLALAKLRKLEEAIASYDKALKIKPDKDKAWHNRGVALHNLGRLEEAIASYDKALEFKPDDHEAWNNRGIALRNLGRLEEAIASYDKALEFKPDFHYAWNNRGGILYDLGRFEEAIASYDQALEIKPDYHKAWDNRTITLKQLRSVEGEISYYDKDYQKQISALKESLLYCPKNTHPEEWGKLHQAIGNAHYRRGRWNSYHFYWTEAVKHYFQSLETLTKSTFIELHLNVLKDLIKALLGLEQTDRANRLSRDATDLLQRLLQQQNYSQLTQQQLTDKLVSFEQLTVNILIKSEQFATALATAETDKNVCLSWLLDALPIPPYKTEETVTHAQIQQLLNPTTAAIYWHLSDAALTTFIIKSDGLLSPETCFSDFPDEFEAWVKEWNQQYTDYKSKEKAGQQNHPWRAGMASKFARLKEILKIDVIEEQLEGITELILIPHRDLHRFPIHALFSRDFVVSYLPSAQFGLNLKHRLNPPTAANTPNTPNTVGEWNSRLHRQNPPPRVEEGEVNSILSIENPNSIIIDENGKRKELLPLPAAEIESEIICRMFANSTRRGENAATLDEVTNLLPQPHNIFHFTGHGSYDFDNPQQSTLYLSDTHRLTVKEIIQLDLSNYKLICLPACETALTDKQTILAEYVGLTSSFMRAGVGCVVSTLWPVESGASTLLMIYFYRRWREAGESLPVGLVNAQKWLRESTREDLAAWYQREIDRISVNSAELSEVEVTLIDSLESDRLALATMELHQPYQHPYYWAAFTITGL